MREHVLRAYIDAIREKLASAKSASEYGKYDNAMDYLGKFVYRCEMLEAATFLQQRADEEMNRIKTAEQDAMRERALA